LHTQFIKSTCKGEGLQEKEKSNIKPSKKTGEKVGRKQRRHKPMGKRRKPSITIEA